MTDKQYQFYTKMSKFEMQDVDNYSIQFEVQLDLYQFLLQTIVENKYSKVHKQVVVDIV
jgi:hypothetical protein